MARDLDYSGVIPYTAPAGKPKAVIVDLDGTLCLHNGRDPYDESRLHTDLPHTNLLRLLWALSAQGFRVIFVSGRGRRPDTRTKTKEWLREHYGLAYEMLLMRAADDSRIDWKVKYDLFNGRIREEYDVVCVFDDRKQVVDMWRALGLLVCQVADHTF